MEKVKASTLIDRCMKPWLKEQGFLCKGALRFKIVNDIAFCIRCEYPQHVWTICSIIPLYIPIDFLHWSYGFRMEEIYPFLPHLELKTTQSEVDFWFQSVKELLLNEVFPFFENISLHKNLLEYVHPKSTGKFLHHGGLWIARLRVYTYLYLLDKKQASKELVKYILVYDSEYRDYFEYFKAEREAEFAMLDELIERTDNEIASHLQSICKETRDKFFN